MSEADERKALAVKDPIAALAQTDGETLTLLLAGISTEDDALSRMLEDLAEESTAAALSTPDRAKSEALETALRSSGIVRLVVAGVDLPMLESALAATGIDNRAEALAAVCRGYLEHREPKG